MYVGKPLVEITTVTGGCGYVSVSWNVIGNNDKCKVFFYNVTLSYIAKDIKSVILVLITTMSSYTFTGLPDDTLFNITVFGLSRSEDVLSFVSTSVNTVEFESM